MTQPTRSSSLAVLAMLALACPATTGCALDATTVGHDTRTATEQRLTLTDPDGHELEVSLLPGSSVSDRGDAWYRVDTGDQTLAVSRVSDPSGWTYIEVTSDQALLGSIEGDARSLSLLGPDGRALHSTTGALPRAEATQVVAPVALTLLTGDSLDILDAAIVGDAADRPSAMLSRQTAEGCPVSCTNWGRPIVQTCCCDVGQKCESTLNTCECKPARTTITAGRAVFGAPTTARR
jgi:hypothetical protein